MSRLLFEMSDAELDREWQRQSERLWEEMNDDHGQCCKYCFHYNSPFCTYHDEEDECPEKDEDDWCEHFDAEDMSTEYDPMEDW